MSTYVQRGNWIHVNDEIPDKRWAFDPTEKGSAIDYLLHVCPTTKDAMAKLAEMRRAIRALSDGSGTKGER